MGRGAVGPFFSRGSLNSMSYPAAVELQSFQKEKKTCRLLNVVENAIYDA